MEQRLRQYPLDAAYLYGSQVKGKAGPLSDVDLGVLFPPSVTLEKRNKITREIFHDLCEALETDYVDVVSLTDVPALLRQQVISKGKKLFVNDVAADNRFIFSTIQLYEDFLPHLQVQAQLMKKHFAYDR